MKIYIPDNFPLSSDPILDLLRQTKTIAVVGLSSNPARASHEVSSYLQSVGYRMIPVNPNETEVLGAKSYPRLEDIPEPIDVVDIFRRAEEVPPVIDSAIAIRVKAVWLQFGVVSCQSCEIARSAGLLAVEDLCLLVEHKRRRSQLAL
jgi:predicted CoA-binding protein